MNNGKKYDDIIDVEYPLKTDRPRMSLYNRASQFAPFAALTGYDALIGETARLTDNRIEMDENMRAELDRSFAELLQNPQKKFDITYFLRDKRKAGGAYLSVSGLMKKYDEIEKTILMTDGTLIPMDDVLSICLCGNQTSQPIIV